MTSMLIPLARHEPRALSTGRGPWPGSPVDDEAQRIVTAIGEADAPGAGIAADLMICIDDPNLVADAAASRRLAEQLARTRRSWLDATLYLVVTPDVEASIHGLGPTEAIRCLGPILGEVSDMLCTPGLGRSDSTLVERLHAIRARSRWREKVARGLARSPGWWWMAHAGRFWPRPVFDGFRADEALIGPSDHRALALVNDPPTPHGKLAKILKRGRVGMIASMNGPPRDLTSMIADAGLPLVQCDTDLDLLCLLYRLNDGQLPSRQPRASTHARIAGAPGMMRRPVGDVRASRLLITGPPQAPPSRSGHDLSLIRLLVEGLSRPQWLHLLLADPARLAAVAETAGAIGVWLHLGPADAQRVQHTHRRTLELVERWLSAFGDMPPRLIVLADPGTIQAARACHAFAATAALGFGARADEVAQRVVVAAAVQAALAGADLADLNRPGGSLAHGAGREALSAADARLFIQ